MLKERLIDCLRGRMLALSALRGTRKLAYRFDMSRFLCSVRLALHPAQRINQRFPKSFFCNSRIAAGPDAPVEDARSACDSTGREQA